MKKLREHSKLFQSIAERYFEGVKKILMKYNKNEEYVELLGKLPSINDISAPNEAFAFVKTSEQLESYSTLLKQILTFITDESYFGELTQTMSGTFIDSQRIIQNSAIKCVDEFNKMLIDYNFEMFASAKLTETGTLQFLAAYDKFNVQVMNLLKTLPNSAEKVKLLGKFKSIISADRPTLAPHVELDPLFIPHGKLEPGPFMTTENLCKLLGCSFADGVFSGQANIICILSTKGTPLEYDIRGLCDAAYIEENKLETNASVGINESVLMRTTTLRLLERFGSNSGATDVGKANSAEVKKIITFAPKKMSATYHVIETFNAVAKINKDMEWRVYSVSASNKLSENDVSCFRQINLFPLSYSLDMFQPAIAVDLNKMKYLEAVFSDAKEQNMEPLRNIVLTKVSELVKASSGQKGSNYAKMLSMLRECHDVIYRFVNSQNTPDMMTTKLWKVQKLMQTLENKLVFLMARINMKGDVSDLYVSVFVKLFDTMERDKLYGDIAPSIKEVHISITL